MRETNDLPLEENAPWSPAYDPFERPPGEQTPDSPRPREEPSDFDLPSDYGADSDRPDCYPDDFAAPPASWFETARMFSAPEGFLPRPVQNSEPEDDQRETESCKECDEPTEYEIFGTLESLRFRSQSPIPASCRDLCAANAMAVEEASERDQLPAIADGERLDNHEESSDEIVSVGSEELRIIEGRQQVEGHQQPAVGRADPSLPENRWERSIRGAILYRAPRRGALHNGNCQCVTGHKRSGRIAVSTACQCVTTVKRSTTVMLDITNVVHSGETCANVQLALYSNRGIAASAHRCRMMGFCSFCWS